MSKILINGANGYLASNLIALLLEKNHQVVALVRPSKETDPTDRMRQALKECTDQPSIYNSQNLEVMSYDLHAEDFGMMGEQAKQLFDDCVDYFHFAATLKFSEKAKDEIFDTNVDGVKNSVNFFQKYANASARFFFVSTAYSCGITTENAQEKIYPIAGIEHFRNYYEQSKRYAEHVIAEEVKGNHLNGYILRPSQVIGNSQTGVTKTDFGVFDFVKRMAYLAKRYPNETVRMRGDATMTQNLIPVDVLVDMMAKVIGKDDLPFVTHLVATEPTRNIDIINHLNSILSIHIVFQPLLQTAEMSALERILDAGMAFTGSYSRCHINFDSQNLKYLGAGETIKVKKETLYQMIAYFLENNA